jgi:hypothetical protein
MNDNKAMTHNLREARDTAEKHDDVGTTQPLETFIDQAERRTWFLFEATAAKIKSGRLRQFDPAGVCRPVSDRQSGRRCTDFPDAHPPQRHA